MSSLHPSIAEIVRDLNEFDRKYLINDPITGHKSYPEHVLPQVNAIRERLRLFVQTDAYANAPTNSNEASSSHSTSPLRDEVMWEVGLNDDLAFLRKKRMAGVGSGASATPSRTSSRSKSRERIMTTTLVDRPRLHASSAEASVDNAIVSALKKINNKLESMPDESRRPNYVRTDDSRSVESDLRRQLNEATQRHRSAITPLLQSKAELETKLAERDETISDLLKQLAEKKAELEKAMANVNSKQAPLFDKDGIDAVLRLAGENNSFQHQRTLEEREQRLKAMRTEYSEEMALLEQQTRDDASMISELQQKVFTTVQELEIAQHNLDVIGQNMDRSQFELLAMVADLERQKKQMGEELYTSQLRRDQLENDLGSSESIVRLSKMNLSQAESEKIAALQQLESLKNRMRETSSQLTKQKMRLASARYVTLWYRERLGETEMEKEHTSKLLRERIHNQPIIVWGEAATTENNGSAQDALVIKTLKEENDALKQERSEIVKDLKNTKRQLDESEAKRVILEQKCDITQQELQRARSLMAPLLAHQRELQALSGLGGRDMALSTYGAESKEIMNENAPLNTSAMIEAAQQHISFIALDSFHGDYMNIRGGSSSTSTGGSSGTSLTSHASNTVLRFILQRGDKEVTFSDLVQCLQSNNSSSTKLVNRLMVITEQFIMLFNPKVVNSTTHADLDPHKDGIILIPHKDITHVSVSRFASNVLVIHTRQDARAPAGYPGDIMLLTGKRLEIVFALLLQCLRIRRRRLTVECAERMYIASSSGSSATSVRTLLVTNTEQYHIGNGAAETIVYNKA